MTTKQKSTVTLILGGVRCGKSRYAQQLAERFEHVVFIATAERRDDSEMNAKIDRHRADRPAHWTTVEEPILLAQAIESVDAACEVIVIDCLTLFSSNLLEAFGHDIDRTRSHIDELCSMLRSAHCPVILVSNEVGSGVVPAYEAGRRFRDLVGEINQQVAAVSDTVVWMVAGLPTAIKGSLATEVIR